MPFIIDLIPIWPKDCILIFQTDQTMQIYHQLIIFILFQYSLAILTKNKCLKPIKFFVLLNHFYLFAQILLIFITYMQKHNRTVNSQSMRPSFKPNILHKSNEIESLNKFDYSQLTQKRNYLVPDSVRETAAITSSNTSRLIENPLYRMDQDLASSFSFSQSDNQYEHQKQLFSKFLQSKQGDWMQLLREMTQIDENRLLTFVKIGQSETVVRNNKIMAHYIGVWLLSMGYRQAQTLKKIKINLQYIYPQEQGISEIGQILYNKLFEGYLPAAQQLHLLIELCKKGWEYLSFFMGRFIKIIKMFKQMEQYRFLQQIQKAILNV